MRVFSAKAMTLPVLASWVVFGAAAKDSPEKASAAALERCVSTLHAPAIPFQAPPAQARVDGLPGLSRGKVEFAESLLDASGAQIYLYYGVSRLEAYCGLAVYGKPAPSMRREIASLAERLRPELSIDDPPHYKLAGGEDADARYWGTLRGPGLMGLLLLERGTSPDKPALEADYHMIFMR